MSECKFRWVKGVVLISDFQHGVVWSGNLRYECVQMKQAGRCGIEVHKAYVQSGFERILE